MNKISAEKLKSLVEGSYEHSIYLLSEALNTKLESVLHVPIRCNIVATFPQYGLGLAEDNTLFKFSYTKNNQENYEITLEEIY